LYRNLNFIIIGKALNKIVTNRKNIIYCCDKTATAGLLGKQLEALEGEAYKCYLVEDMKSLQALDIVSDCDALLVDYASFASKFNSVQGWLQREKITLAILGIFQTQEDLSGAADFVSALDEFLSLDSMGAAECQVRIARTIERSKRERALVMDQNLLQSLLESIPDAVYFKDDKSRFTRVSRAMLVKYGKDFENIRGMTDFDLFTDEHARPAYEDEIEIIRTGKALVGKLEKETLKSGQVKWANTTKVPLRNERGRIIGTLGISRDVSDLQEAQEKLRTERNLLRSILNNLPDRIYVKDPQGHYLRANPPQIQFLGAPSEKAVIGTTLCHHLRDEAALRAFAVEKKIIREIKPVLNKEERQLKRNGESVWYLTSKVPFFDEEGALVGTIGISRDITFQKQTELKLREAIQTLEETKLQVIEVEKFNTIGRMAAGIAHEVKNPLAVVSLGLEFLEDKFKGDANILDMVVDMKIAIEKANTIIFDLMDYSASREDSMVAQDINSQIKRILKLMKHNFEKGGVMVYPEFSDKILWVEMESSRMEQVFMNLFLNALAVMPRGGDLTVRTREERLKKAGANVSAKITERFRIGDPLAIIEIEDSGSGIDPAHADKIFDPFFSTRSTEDGTGLGLSVTRNIVEMHRGMITLENRPNQRGACATLIFPITPKP
jgi:PAS domain S-box-containing protein